MSIIFFIIFAAFIIVCVIHYPKQFLLTCIYGFIICAIGTILFIGYLTYDQKQYYKQHSCESPWITNNQIEQCKLIKQQADLANSRTSLTENFDDIGVEAVPPK